MKANNRPIPGAECPLLIIYALVFTFGLVSLAIWLILRAG